MKAISSKMDSVRAVSTKLISIARNVTIDLNAKSVKEAISDSIDSASLAKIDLVRNVNSVQLEGAVCAVKAIL